MILFVPPVEDDFISCPPCRGCEDSLGAEEGVWQQLEDMEGVALSGSTAHRCYVYTRQAPPPPAGSLVLYPPQGSYVHATAASIM